MNEQASSLPEQPANPGPGETQNENLVADYYDSYKDTQAEVFRIFSRKAGKTIIITGIIFLLSNFIGLAINDMWYMEVVVETVIICALFIGLGLYARKQPLAAVLLALALYIGLNILTAIQLGPEVLLKGWLSKVVIISLLLSGLNNAREAMQAKKEIQ